MLSLVLLGTTSALGAGDPNADFITGPAVQSLGSIVHALAIAPSGSQDREKLSEMACGQAQDLIVSAAYVRDFDTSVQKAVSQAVLVIFSLPAAVGCTVPEVELPFPLQPAATLTFLGRQVDPSFLSMAPPSTVKASESPREGIVGIHTKKKERK